MWVSLLRCHVKLDKFRKDETRCSLLRKSGILSVPDGFFFFFFFFFFLATFNDR